MSAAELTADIVRTLLLYDAETGELTWRESAQRPPEWNSRYAGRPAGCTAAQRRGHTAYRSITISNRHFLAHRVAWLCMTGAWPPEQIDHIDQNGLNNRWNNLRLATASQNGANTRRHSRNKTGFKGVSSASGKLPYRATIRLDGRQVVLGYFSDPESAHAAYAAAAHEHRGEFARVA